MSPIMLRKPQLLSLALAAGLALLVMAHASALAQEPVATAVATAAADAAADAAAVPAAVLAQNDIRINEVMASNGKTLVDPDEAGETPDWFELYNPGPGAVSLDGLGLADGDPIETGFVISPGLTIPEGGFVIFYADDDTTQGAYHTDFALSAGGESVILYRVATKEEIDRIDFPKMETDQSYGRKPDGVGSPAFLPAASPGSTNAVNPPRLSDLSKPPYPAPISAPVAVSVTVTDNVSLVSVTLFYSTSLAGLQQTPMAAVGGNVYEAAIPGQPANTLVTYYVKAVDNENESGRTPLAGRERRYLTGYVAPVLVINEVVLDNADQYIDPDEPLETPDWLEIYNPGPGSVSLNGLSLTDDNDLPLRFVIPNGLSLGAGERMVFLADDDKGQNTIRNNQPPLHLPFNLNQSNEFIGLYGGQGSVKIDDYDVDEELPFSMAARIPDGGDWNRSVCRTFNAPNIACDARVYAPSISR